jgi:alpha-L-fucosidase
MTIKKLSIIVLCFATTILSAVGQDKIKEDNPEKMEWFEDAKLGIFIHYGIYAVNGIPESWSFFKEEISYDDYMKQLKGFTAKNYDAAEWAKLFKEAGAKYAVLTSKHHDGVALWDTKLSDMSVVKKSPAKRDLIGPYAKALRKEGLKVGLYFSHLDWSHPDYNSVYHGDTRNPSPNSPFDYPLKRKEDPAGWKRFLDFHRGQLKELYHLANPDLWWFDGVWTRTAEQWKMKELRDTLLSWNPNTILNARMKGYGDYATPEQGIPIVGPKGTWELCMTINDSWGYQKDDHNQKSVNYLIRVFSECISMGGNLLLDVGPTADGKITTEQTERLKGLGRWTSKHAEAIYGSRRGLPLGHYFGPTTLSKDKKTIYCFIQDIPREGIVVKGIINKVERVRMIGTNQELHFERNGGAPWMNIPGVLQVDIAHGQLDENVSVVAIDLDSPLKLYRGEGGAIENN